jgi:hypothetical protein
MINQSVCILDFNIACETSAVQEWILFSLNSSVEIIMIFYYPIQCSTALSVA